MLPNGEFIRISLEINLFFQRIIKEHMLLIETHLPPIERALITEANVLKKSFEELLGETVIIANRNISSEAINSNEIVTKYTLAAEEITSQLTGASININITKAELELVSGKPHRTPWLEEAVDNINKRSLNILEHVLGYKRNLLNLFLQCKVALMIYPDMLQHLIEEAEYYEDILRHLIERKLPDKNTCKNLNFWNHIMGEHAEFIDGMLDPTEKELKILAEEFAKRFEELVEECIKSAEKEIIRKSLDATEDIRDYKESATEGILKCEIKSIIPPILADHVLREANHYLRLLKKEIR